jgi:hypothetical protein
MFKVEVAGRRYAPLGSARRKWRTSEAIEYGINRKRFNRRSPSARS